MDMAKPKIRFKGYQEDWEQRKFGELADYKKGPFGSALKKDIFVPKSDTTVKVYEQQNAINKDWRLERYFITEEYVNKLSGFRVEGGDIIVSCAGTIGETYEIPMDAEPGIINQALMKIKVKESIVNKSMFNILFTNMIDDFTRVHSNGSAIKNIPPFSDLKSMEVFVPEMDEQNKISSYFSSLDNLITLHQRKLYHFVKRESFAWEQRKLGDVFQEYSEKNYTELPTLTIIQGGGTVKREDSDRNLMYNESNLSNYKMVRKDDFIVHLRSFEGGLEKSSLDGIISPAYHTFHSDVADSRFYYPYFRSHEFIKHKLVPHVYGIRDGRSIDISGMKTIEIPYTSMEEQRTIGDYLESLDNLITLHQRKYEELQKVKKFMLQNMFV